MGGPIFKMGGVFYAWGGYRKNIKNHRFLPHQGRGRTSITGEKPRCLQ